MAKKMKVCSFCGKTEDKVLMMIQGNNGVCACSECITGMYDTLLEYESNGNLDDLLTDIQISKPSEIKGFLDEYVIGQESAKITLSVSIYNHYKRILYHNRHMSNDEIEIQKSNILMIGSTGSGKTYLAQSLAKFLGVPFAIADATTLTEAGYVGEDVENILLTLLQNADFDNKLAEKGIIYIDEIDKLSRKSENMSTTRDVGGEGVQQSLLKIIEGTISRVPLSGGRKHPQAECVDIDTSNILFICSGAFSGLEKIIEQRNNKGKSIGFNADVKSAYGTSTLDLSDVQQHDLVKYGLMPELIGRLPVITTLQPLSEDDLVKILTEPKNALAKQYQELLAMDGVKLEFEDDALKRIAELAIKKEIGARGLRSIIEKAMQNVMFSIPDRTDAKKVVVTSGMIDGIEEAVVYGSKNKKIA
ncbi:ATP-dependent Clp protease ATP-binding subunit ClpX [Roseburia sp. 1XD42-69]|uniref:ATP-dependent Clp protease ATP-binding subunit ClpX n=1 Tax=Roseburia sp. 1XD42-69 TaxID=2320088 RepID=UPI000EA3D5A4|nr:ATP-dependent Clp protease ATP-binding subunit ClpX [Roseburia sp. 1XD42-69]RKJ62069.1 ATP-dependent Clp protease ATP-binding subunit ClpX [Roseburia sp. 1XD42-69]